MIILRSLRRLLLYEDCNYTSLSVLQHSSPISRDQTLPHSSVAEDIVRVGWGEEKGLREFAAVEWPRVLQFIGGAVSVYINILLQEYYYYASEGGLGYVSTSGSISIRLGMCVR